MFYFGELCRCAAYYFNTKYGGDIQTPDDLRMVSWGYYDAIDFIHRRNYLIKRNYDAGIITQTRPYVCFYTFKSHGDMQIHRKYTREIIERKKRIPNKTFIKVLQHRILIPDMFPSKISISGRVMEYTYDYYIKPKISTEYSILTLEIAEGTVYSLEALSANSDYLSAEYTCFGHLRQITYGDVIVHAVNFRELTSADCKAAFKQFMRDHSCE